MDSQPDGEDRKRPVSADQNIECWHNETKQADSSQAAESVQPSDEASISAASASPQLNAESEHTAATELAKRGFLLEAIKDVAKALITISAMAHVFSLDHFSSCLYTYNAIYDSLVNERVSFEEFMSKHTKRWPNFLDSRPRRKPVEQAVSSRISATQALLPLKDAADRLAKRILKQVQQELRQSRPARISSMLAAQHDPAQLIEDASSRLTAILDKLQAAVSRPDRHDLIVQQCSLIQPSYHQMAARYDPQLKLMISWIAFEEQLGEQHVSIQQMLPLGGALCSHDEQAAQQCGLSRQAIVDLAACHKLLLAQPILQSREQKVLIVVADQQAGRTAVHLLLPQHSSSRYLQPSTQQTSYAVCLRSIMC